MLGGQVHELVTAAEFMATTNNLNSDIQQKLLDLRSEVFTRMTDMNC